MEEALVDQRAWVGAFIARPGHALLSATEGSRFSASIVNIDEPKRFVVEAAGRCANHEVDANECDKL